jgi:hypothetical protein
MKKLLIEYKRLKAQLTANVGCEESMDEVGWNDGVMEAMEILLECVPKDIVQRIRLE